MAIAIASAVIGACSFLLSIINKMQPTLREKLPPTLKGKLKHLDRKMREIHSKLLLVERTGTHANRWQQQIREVTSDVKDLLDDLKNEEQRRTSSKVHNPFLSNLPDHEMIGDIKEDLVNLNKTLLELITQPVADEEWTQQTWLLFEHEDLIGREVEKDKIVEFLLSENNNGSNTYSIVGIGGVGKTALAQVICQEAVQQNLVVKWAHVGFKKFNLREILFRIETNMEKNNSLETQRIILKERLGTETRYLFVLDDLWDIRPVKWLELKSMLLDINKGNKILITTRNQRIAEIAAKDKTVFLKPLEPGECLPLIKKYSDKIDRLPTTTREEIIKECEGVPMAAITLGLKLSEGRDSIIWTTVDVESEDNIMNSLKFSYDYLPPDLQNCFAYHVVCNGILHKERLTQMWTAQGFIEEPDVDASFEKLKNASFFHDVTEDIFTGTQFKVLKLFRALIFLVSKEYADTTASEITGVSGSTRHVSLSPQRNAQEVQESRLLGKLRTVVGLPEIRLLSEFKGLRVLVLFGVEFKSSDISFGNLKHLRYLDLSRNGNLEVLPESLGGLLFLETLRVDMCEKLKALLPNGINNLTNPRYLYARKMSYFAKLETLEILDCPRLCFQVTDMEDLKNLKRLSIIKHPDLTNLPEGFRSLASLENLTIEGCPRLETSLSTVDGLNILPDKMKLLRMKRSDELTEIYKRGEGDDRSWIKEVYRMNPVPNVEPSPSSSSVETGVLTEESNGGTNGNGEGSSTHHHQSDGTSFGKILWTSVSKMTRKRKRKRKMNGFSSDSSLSRGLTHPIMFDANSHDIQSEQRLTIMLGTDADRARAHEIFLGDGAPRANASNQEAITRATS